MKADIQIAVKMSGASQEVLRQNETRVGLVLQNNGAANVYLSFGVAAEASANCLLLPAGAMMVLDAFAPTSSLNALGAVGDTLVIVEGSDWYEGQ